LAEHSSMITTLSLIAKDQERIADGLVKMASLQGETLRAVVGLGEREKEKGYAL